METVYRVKTNEIGNKFLQSLKNLFPGQEVEITVRAVEDQRKSPYEGKQSLLEMMRENSKNAPVIGKEIDIRALIDESQCPE